MKRIISLVLLACLILPLLVTCATAEVSYPAEGVTNTTRVKIRQKTSQKSKLVKTIQKKGQEITVEGEEEDASGNLWYSITTPKGTQGFMLAEYVDVPDTEAIEAADKSSEKAAMTVTIKAEAGNMGGLGKNWTKFYKVNGVLTDPRKGAATVAPNVEFSLMTIVKKGDAVGIERTDYTPTEDEVKNGFTVSQAITAEHKAKGKSAEWSVSYTFTPKGGKAKKETATTKETTSKTDKTATTDKTDKNSKTDTTKKSDEEEIVFDLGTKSGDKPTSVVERKIAFYADREVEVTKRVPDGETKYYVYETDESGKQVQVEKTRTRYKTVKETVILKNQPVYQDEIDNGTYVPLEGAESGSSSTSAKKATSSEDEEAEDEDVEMSDEEEEVEEEEE